MPTTTIPVIFSLTGVAAAGVIRQLAAYNAAQQTNWNKQEAAKKAANAAYTPVAYTPITAADYASMLAQQFFTGVASQELTRRLKDPVHGPKLEAFLASDPSN